MNRLTQVPGSTPATISRPIVFMVGGDESVRCLLEGLSESEDFTLECFASAGGFLMRPPPSGPSCLLLDVHLPDHNGLDLQRKVAAERAEMPIIFITACGEVPVAVCAMKAGAAEFLTKPCRYEVLASAVQQALERSRAALQDAYEKRSLKDRYAALTRREREVMALVVSGLLNKQIAGELGLSEITVKAHRGSLVRKMKARSLASLVIMAAKLGLPEPLQ